MKEMHIIWNDPTIEAGQIIVSTNAINQTAFVLLARRFLSAGIQQILFQL